jgi:hypothetical protein
MEESHGNIHRSAGTVPGRPQLSGNTMSDADSLRSAFVSLELNGEFSEAVLIFSDGSSLCFRHKGRQKNGESDRER